MYNWGIIRHHILIPHGPKNLVLLYLTTHAQAIKNFLLCFLYHPLQVIVHTDAKLFKC